MNKKTKARKIYIGVAWPYVNDLFHLGNLAGAYLPPDIFSRFHKLCGNEVMMISGSDFHGTPTTIRAEKEGVKPIEIAQRFHELDKEYLKRFRIDYSLYTTTHTKNHQQTTQEMFLRLLKNGFIKILKTKQLYSEKTDKFLQDRYIEGECPYCHAKDARGDQCEKCGRVLDSLELINPVSKIDKSVLTIRETENYFLDLEKLEKVVKKYLLSRKKMRVWVRNEALGWIKEGLRPRAITRDMDYGVLLPVDRIAKEKRISNIEKKVFYVWFEAVIGYLSGAIEYSKRTKSPALWRKFFYGAEGETYYFVGQDNLVFHTINWPAQLFAYDKNINLPTNVFVNKFLLLEGKKMSKSRGWYLDNRDILENYSVDSLRFYLSLNNPETKEFSFGWEDFVKTNNNILVATIGNLAYRSFSFAEKNFGKKSVFNGLSVSSPLQLAIKECFIKTAKNIDQGEAREALQHIINLCAFGNQFFDRAKPWEMVKNDPQKTKAFIGEIFVLLSNLRILLYPFVPTGAEELNKMLGFSRMALKKGFNQWEFSVPSRIRLAEEIKPLFIKIPEERIEIEKEKLKKIML
ncbi:MAG: methionine--tRNA ligase [bacterium]